MLSQVPISVFTSSNKLRTALLAEA
uniref:Uncharacterized protein n=1 Tax=Rhizophora mucronata TaxID=61149 RepID=A0A2P2QCH9_RHIMU